MKISTPCVRAARAAGLVALFALWPLSGPLFAQDTDRDAGRDGARNAPLPDSVAFELSPLEVISSIAPTAASEIGSGIPARISTIDGRSLDGWEPRVLAEVLGSQPGVSVYDDLGSPYKLNISSRGFHAGPTVGLPSGISVFLDGVPQNEPAAQEVNFDLLPLEHVERIEVLHGNASLLGPNSLGGAVNLITRKTFADAEVRASGVSEGSGERGMGGSFELSGGSFGSVSGQGAMGVRTESGWDVYGGGGYEEEGGWRQATSADRTQGFLSLARSSSLSGIHFQALWTDSRAATAGSLPESIYRSRPTVNFTAGDFEALELGQVAVSGFRPLLNGRASMKAYVRRTDAERFNVNQPPDSDVRSISENGTVGVVADWRRSAAAGGATLSFRTGLDLAANRVRVRIFEEERGTGEGELTTDVESPSTDVAAYAMADFLSDRVRLSAGVRFDYTRVPFDDLLDPSADTVSSFDHVSPRAGMSVDVGWGAVLFASAGKSFRAPAILELACSDPEDACPLPFALGDDPPLDPVTAVNLEAGARWERGGETVTVSVYRTDVDDEIFFVPSEESIVEGFFSNLGDTRRAGIEVSGETALTDVWSLYGSWVFTRATFRTTAEIFSARADDDFEGSALAGENQVRPGDRLPLVPTHQVKVGGSYQPVDWLRVGFDGRYFGEQWLRGDEGNETRPLDGYFVANARLGILEGPWEVDLIADNLFDSDAALFGTFNVNHQSGELERFLTPVETRSWRLQVTRRFGGG